MYLGVQKGGAEICWVVVSNIPLKLPSCSCELYADLKFGEIIGKCSALALLRHCDAVLEGV